MSVDLYGVFPVLHIMISENSVRAQNYALPIIYRTVKANLTIFLDIDIACYVLIWHHTMYVFMTQTMPSTVIWINSHEVIIICLVWLVVYVSCSSYTVNTGRSSQDTQSYCTNTALWIYWYIGLFPWEENQRPRRSRGWYFSSQGNNPLCQYSHRVVDSIYFTISEVDAVITNRAVIISNIYILHCLTRYISQ